MVIHSCHSLIDLFNIYIYLSFFTHPKPTNRSITASQLTIQPDKLNLYYLGGVENSRTTLKKKKDFS